MFVTFFSKYAQACLSATHIPVHLKQILNLIHDSSGYHRHQHIIMSAITSAMCQWAADSNNTG
jgi:hypothetical protein